MYILTYKEGSFIIEDSRGQARLTSEIVRQLTYEDCVVLGDLTNFGLKLIGDHMLEYRTEIKVKSYSLDIKYIEFGQSIWKNSNQFGLDNDSLNSESVNNLADFLWKTYNVTLRSRGVVSMYALSLKYARQRGFKTYGEHDVELKTFIEQAYYGGRSQIFVPGKHLNTLHYDFPSMYGTFLCEDLPVKLEWTKADLGFESPGFYEVAFSGARPIVPALPMSQSVGRHKKVSYPTYGRGVYWHEELKDFISRGGRVDKILRVARVVEAEPFLRDISTRLIRRKSLGCRFSKLALNGSYGRLAYWKQANSDLIMSAKEFACSEMLHSFRAFQRYNDLILVEAGHRERSRAEDANVAAAAAVAAKARVKLAGLLDRLEASGCVILAVETDSVYFSGNPGHMEGYTFSKAVSVDLKVR